jgi:hypothetical protein
MKNLQKQTKLLLAKLNLSRWIVHHLIGKNHSNSHRQIIGALIMILGVGLTKVFGEFSSEAIRFIGDVVGYGFHGIGLIPFISTIESID